MINKIPIKKSSDGYPCCSCDYRRYKRGFASSGMTKAYKAWQSMKQRCLNPNTEQYQHYGARGVTVCEEWLNDFNRFFNDMGHPLPGCSLDKDVKGGIGCKIYSAKTCMWATIPEQANANRRSVLLTHKGVTQTIAQWARQLNINPATLGDRLKAGFSIDKCLSTKRSNERLLELNGVQKTLPAWSEILGIPISTIHGRLKKGLSAEQALRTKNII